MTRLLGAFLCSAVLGIFAAGAQNVSVTGVVTDQTAKPLNGVAVMVRGTSTGVNTDPQGRYTISVPERATLVFSAVGFDEQTANVGVRRTINITMRQATIVTDRAVVTALGIRRDTRALGYATSTITGDDMIKAGTMINPLTTLYGKAAGLGIQSSVSGPMGSVNIKIRGAAGLESSSKTRPLFVVDGVPIYDTDGAINSRGYDPLNSFDYGSGINDINPEDIESMEILKGAKASVLYGSEGANGVVLITTKKGTNTRGLGVTMSWQHTWEKPHSYIEWQNEYGEGNSTDWDASFKPKEGESGFDYHVNSHRQNFGPKFDGTTMIRFYDGTVAPYQAYANNWDDLFQTGHSNTFNAAISGGNDKGNMRISYTRTDYQGTVNNNWQKRNTISFSGRMNVSDFASFEVTSNLYNTDSHNRYGNIQDIVGWGFHRGYNYNLLKDVYLTEDGRYMNREFYDGMPSGQNSARYLMDWWWSQDHNSNLDSKLHNVSSARVTLQFMPWLRFIGQAGLDYANTNYTTKNPVRYKDTTTGILSGGKYAFKRDNSMVQNLQGILNFEKDYMDDQLSVNVYAGYDFRSSTNNDINVATYGDLKYDNWYSLNNGSSWPAASNAGTVRGHSRGSDVTYGVFGAATVGWKGTYYLEVQARNDWSSTLPPANNSYFYPGVSFTYNFSDDFKVPGLTYGKLFTSFADVGRPAPRYYALKSYTIETVETQPDVNRVSGPSDLFAGDLKPERKREFEIGLSSRWLNNRIEFNYSFYTNNIYDQIMGVALSNPTGASQIRINAGNVRNWGHEFYVKGTPWSTDNWRLDLALTAANQGSKVIKLYPGIKSKTLGGSGYNVVATEGERYGDIMMFNYITAPDGQRVISADGWYTRTTKLENIGKNVTPDVFGGLTGDLSYKSLSFHFGIDYKFGGSMFSYSNYYLTGLGLTKNTLAYRDESKGGLAYYVKDGKNIAANHTDAQGPNGEPIYHNGMVLDGVVDNGDGSFSKNESIINSTTYYTQYLNDGGNNWLPDAVKRNDYIKLREVSLAYTLPAKWARAVKLQKVTVSLTARNLFYFYKTIPNIDPESTAGSSGEWAYREQSFYPTIRTYGFGINVSF